MGAAERLIWLLLPVFAPSTSPAACKLPLTSAWHVPFMPPLAAASNLPALLIVTPATWTPIYTMHDLHMVTAGGRCAIPMGQTFPTLFAVPNSCQPAGHTSAEMYAKLNTSMSMPVSISVPWRAS